jgi:hypothetical protein
MQFLRLVGIYDFYCGEFFFIRGHLKTKIFKDKMISSGDFLKKSSEKI